MQKTRNPWLENRVSVVRSGFYLIQESNDDTTYSKHFILDHFSQTLLLGEQASSVVRASSVLTAPQTFFDVVDQG